MRLGEEDVDWLMPFVRQNFVVLDSTTLIRVISYRILASYSVRQTEWRNEKESQHRYSTTLAFERPRNVISQKNGHIF